MAHRWLGLAKATWIVLGLLVAARSALASPELEPDNLPVPPVPAVPAVDAAGLPAVPRFELPPGDGGLHHVRELRVRRDGLLGAELSVKGYIVWIYDCATALARPGVPLEETRLLIDDNPELCERPKFYLGATPQTQPEAALWVVDVPRKANKRELLALSESQLQARPAVPRLALGALVAVTGTFALQSPHGEHNTDGLLVYKQLTQLAPERRPVAVAASAMVARATDRARATAAQPTPGLAATINLAPPRRVAVPTRNRNDSIDKYERCNQALDAKQLGAALRDCRQAVASWSGNHLAWYALGNALAARDDWPAALDAYGRAAQLRPDAAMYQLYSGVAQYKAAVGQAARDGKQPPRREAAVLAPSSTGGASRSFGFAPYQLATVLTAGTARGRLDAARVALATAARLAPRLALAWYYLGRTERERGDEQRAAEAFTQSIQCDPTQPEPYIALLQLYRAWDFRDQSVAVARHAGIHVTTGKTAGLWYELGMAYEAARRDDDALEAFGHAIAGGTTLALFQRGQIYARTSQLDRAKRDLEAFLVAPGTFTGPIRQIARSMLAVVTREPGANHVYLRVPRP